MCSFILMRPLCLIRFYVYRLKPTSLMPAMVQLIRWQFDNSNPDAFDKWWIDMRIDTQLMCEKALQYCGRGGSLLYFSCENRVLYMIDLVLMIQQNLKTGRVRSVRRILIHNFSLSENYFHRGELKRKRPPDPDRDKRQRKWK